MLIALLAVQSQACAATAPKKPAAKPATANTKPETSTVQSEVVDGVQVFRNLYYTTNKNQDKAQSLDLYLPLNAPAQKPLPLIAYIHGGGWLNCDKSDPECATRCIGLAKKGYAAASVNYRLCSAAIWPAQIYDCKAAIRYLRSYAKQLNLDTQKFGVWGSSSGGHLAALLGVTANHPELEGPQGYNDQSSAVQAVCTWSGPTDLTTLKQQVIQLHIGREILSAASILVGGSINADNEAAVKASPVSYVSNTAPPFLIMHGDNDYIVPVAQSQEFADALRSKGAKEVELTIIPNGRHDNLGKEAQKQTVDFFAKYLKPELQ